MRVLVWVLMNMNCANTHLSLPLLHNSSRLIPQLQVLDEIPFAADNGTVANISDEVLERARSFCRMRRSNRGTNIKVEEGTSEGFDVHKWLERTDHACKLSGTYWARTKEATDNKQRVNPRIQNSRV